MPTSSFDKEFKLNTPKSVDSFLRMVATPRKSIKIKKELLSRETQSEEKIKEMLSYPSVENKEK